MARQGDPRRTIGAFALVAILIALAPAAARADDRGPEIRGSVSTVYYHLGDGSDSGLEHADADARVLERVRLSALRLAPGLDFHSSASFRQWSGGERGGDNASRLYQAYFEWKARPKAGRSLFGARVGRQFLTGYGTPGILDGGSISMTWPNASAGAFFGSREAGDDLDHARWPERFDQSHWYGLRGSVRSDRWFDMGLGYDEIRRDDDTVREMFTADAGVRVTRELQLRYEVRYDRVPEYLLGRALRGTWRPNARHEAWFEWGRRRADLDPSSFLARFRDLWDHDIDELRVGGRTTLPRDVQVSGAVSGIDHRTASPALVPGSAGSTARDPEHWSIDATSALAWRGQSVGYWGSWGYGGARNQFFGSIGRELRPGLNVSLDGSLFDYKYGTGEVVEDDAATWRLRTEWRYDRWTRFGVDLELLDNRVSSSDFRVLVKARRGFSFGGGQGGGR